MRRQRRPSLVNTNVSAAKPDTALLFSCHSRSERTSKMSPPSIRGSTEATLGVSRPPDARAACPARIQRFPRFPGLVLYPPPSCVIPGTDAGSAATRWQSESLTCQVNSPLLAYALAMPCPDVARAGLLRDARY
eukprot:3731683-Rhodomonas_salina.1